MRKVRKFFKRLLITLTILLVLVAGLYLFRKPILKGIGYSLVYEDSSVKVDAAFILSSSPTERGELAADLYHRNMFPVIFTMGEAINPSLAAINIQQTDAELTKRYLVQLGVPDSLVRAINRGTSTYEESEEILGFANAKGFEHIMIITSQLHTRRVKNTFKKKFSDSGIEVVIQGASPNNYDIDHWWESEEAMINVNNEYVKLLYYRWKY